MLGVNDGVLSSHPHHSAAEVGKTKASIHAQGISGKGASIGVSTGASIDASIGASRHAPPAPAPQPAPVASWDATSVDGGVCSRPPSGLSHHSSTAEDKVAGGSGGGSMASHASITESSRPESRHSVHSADGGAGGESRPGSRLAYSEGDTRIDCLPSPTGGGLAKVPRSSHTSPYQTSSSRTVTPPLKPPDTTAPSKPMPLRAGDWPDIDDIPLDIHDVAGRLRRGEELPDDSSIWVSLLLVCVRVRMHTCAGVCGEFCLAPSRLLALVLYLALSRSLSLSLALSRPFSLSRSLALSLSCSLALSLSRSRALSLSRSRALFLALSLSLFLFPPLYCFPSRARALSPSLSLPFAFSKTQPPFSHIYTPTPTHTLPHTRTGAANERHSNSFPAVQQNSATTTVPAATPGAAAPCQTPSGFFYRKHMSL